MLPRHIRRHFFTLWLVRDRPLTERVHLEAVGLLRGHLQGTERFVLAFVLPVEGLC